MKVITNNVPRDIVDACELTPREREEFDYLKWEKIDAGEDSASFVRFKGELYDLGEFTADYGITKDSGLPEHLSRWDGYMSEHAFSAIVVRFERPGCERVIVGRVCS
ncbi:hypothetical protein [Kribbella sindirgiensis]|uniref:Uncharacterized protein n=1 Tax=Kribbella sindirgiensis TaxID=1124744 RepID=A0A4R0I074_9ACTN|nr:hypothetical protein [Kribbella sindirgiensis]TCC19950.1 hypothetical protein E0H50_37605 [Kribbella sindirgiensis]